ncbi:hypothetical protein GGQ73_004417 [Rhizobium skierniewicense]|uniref:Uncharacterized protein n=1 Tax=Rhizobium skierniewicense TaxID=984260 RepID=A0A7W6CA13_9HYPH|nr:hypothetical protein [Rhizobium skierniewicense]MBB3948430.1 hypothetical protein [Rhizobium skierniewicense]
MLQPLSRAETMRASSSHSPDLFWSGWYQEILKLETAMFNVANANATITAFLIDPKVSTIEAVTMASDKLEIEVNQKLECLFTVTGEYADGFRIVSDKNAAMNGIHAFVESKDRDMIIAGKVVLFEVNEAGKIIDSTRSASMVSELVTTVIPVLDPIYDGGNDAPENGIRIHGTPLDGFRVRLRRSSPVVK